MSNSLALASVTATLALRLQAAVAHDVLGARVQPGRPDAGGNGVRPPGVNIFLYQVSPSISYNEDDAPTRRGDGTLARRPQAFFNLHYLLTCHGDELNYEPDRLLGTIIRTMHSRPTLDRQDIVVATDAAPFSSFPLKSDLSTQVERVRFSPLALTLEELSNLWSVFFQIPYSLSIAYQAGTVLIEGDEIPSPRLPVRERQIYVRRLPTFNVIDVVAATGPNDPIVPGTLLAVTGEGLAVERPSVLINGFPYKPLSVSDSRVTLVLPKEVRAGICGLQIASRVSMGEPARLHTGFESNAVAFISRPNVLALGTPSANIISISIEPAVHVGQSVTLLLNSIEPDGGSYLFGGGTVTETTRRVEIGVFDVPPGTYLVRVRVDGAESVLAVEADPKSAKYLQYVGPTVVLP